MVGSIDPRCEIFRGTHWPVEVARLYGTRVAENHLGQRSSDRINRPDIWMQAIRSDHQKTLVARGPSTYGSRPLPGRLRRGLGLFLPRHHQRVDDGDALPLRMHQHRIDLDFGNLRTRSRREHGNMRNQLRQCRDVGFRRTPKAIEQGCCLQLGQHG